MKHRKYYSPLLATTALILTPSLPALAQQSDTPKASRAIEEVMVTARRKEEAAQDVAISMSVFSQKQLDEANITNPSDLALYTPSLQANNRFGGDNTTFAIRGFSQELRTTASVGVYFAEVVAPRGANAQQSGDGASPGDLFDLANVQVLKGPQGTLFGRNTTGGAILLVPKKPSNEFEGYVEISHGNYDLWQQQAVVNAPITDNFRLRLAIDHKERDGYLNNFSGIGPSDFADVKYTSYRLSTVWDLTENLENYTIFKHTDSENNGYPGAVLGCYEGPISFATFFATACRNDLNRRAANGNDGFYDVYSSVPEPVNKQQLSQIINTTTWQLSDDILIKNILSYATLETWQRSSLFGENWSPQPIVGGTAPFIFQQVGLADDLPTTDQNTIVEEIQVQGSSFESRLNWQAGLYYEKSRPGSNSGAQSPAIISCDQQSITSPNGQDLRCNNRILNAGRVVRLEGGVEYTNQGIYYQSTYDLNDVLSLTTGLRYTRDDTKGKVAETIYNFPFLPDGQYAPPEDIGPDITDSNFNRRAPKETSEAPTWLLGLDYKPTEDLLLYAKYVRGYRQGSVNIAGSRGYDKHKPEEVDTYEVGAKTQFEAIVPGTFNIAAFYNDFRDMQVQFGYFNSSNVGTTAVTNAGKATIWGVEMDGSLMLPGDILLTASYSHLDTEIKELNFPDLDPGVQSPLLGEPSITTAVGEPLSLVPRNQFVGSAAWLLPVSPELGDLKFSVTYVFTDRMQAVSKASSPLAVLPQYEIWNLNFSWDAMFGSNFDLSAFITNAKDEEYITYIAGTYVNAGIETGSVGQPRMYGARLRYTW